MVISENKNVVFTLNPKTGSQSSFLTIKNACELYYCESSHSNYTQAIKKLNLSNFDHYVFYRDPLDRAVSACVYMKRRFVGALTSMFYDRFTIRKPSTLIVNPKEYASLPEDLKKEIEEITIEDILSVKRICEPEIGGLAFRNQRHWLDHPNTILLNYADYNNELKRVVEAFGGSVSDDQIAKINTSVRYETDTLSDETIKKVKEMYAEDYEFFDRKGIKFNK